MLRPHGVVHASGCDGPEFTRDTVMCGHCNKHGVFRPGCGKRLGKCLKCMSTLCPDCAKQAETSGECLPLEKRLDLFEAGKLASL